MNFQMCQQAPGQWLMLKGIARRYEFKIHPQYGKYALGDLEDQTGQKEKMMFAAREDSPLPEQSLLNIPCVFAVQWDANKQKYKAYFKSFSNGQPQAAQAPRQQAPQGRDQSIERQATWKGNCVLVAAMVEKAEPAMTLNEVKNCMVELCVLGHDWIATGNIATSNVAGGPDDAPPPTDDDIPF